MSEWNCGYADVSRANTEYMCLNGTPLESVNLRSAQLPLVTEFKYMGSTLQSDGDMSTEINKRTQCGWNNWMKMSSVLCDKRVSPRVKEKSTRLSFIQICCTGWRQCQSLSSHMKKLEVIDMKMCRWECDHTLSDHERNENISERLNVDSITEVQESKTDVVWPRKRRDQDYVGRQTLERVPPGRRTRGRPKQRWMDCVNRDMRAIGTTKHEVHDRTGWMRIVSAVATPQPSGRGQKKKKTCGRPLFIIDTPTDIHNVLNNVYHLSVCIILVSVPSFLEYNYSRGPTPDLKYIMSFVSG